MKQTMKFLCVMTATITAVTWLIGCSKNGDDGPTPPPPPSDYTDLSVNGTANCYIVSTPGKYCFPATVKGGSTESVGTPVSAEVLWESFGTKEMPGKGDIVDSVSYSDGRVYFNSGEDGNAVIAVKDASGVILWSWHIWVCAGFNPATSAQVYNNGAGTMMDRNLGATSATPGDVKALGLLYQWGRKDPFPGSDSISFDPASTPQRAASTGTWDVRESNIKTGTFSFVVQNPMTFIKAGRFSDWYYNESSFAMENSRWMPSDTVKGLYDPCPAGWRVPDGDTAGVWATAFGTKSSWTTPGNWSDEKKGMDFGATDKKLGSGVIWYPAAGNIIQTNATLGFTGEYGYFWSSTPGWKNPDLSNVFILFIKKDGGVNPSFLFNRAYAFSVRCAKE